MTKFNYVSLFSGIGGFEQALNKLGGNCVLASEIDKHANKAYETLYGHPTAGDITKINENDVPDHDLLAFGFPCQAFSIAGKKLGFEDTRGTLFFEAARIAKVKQPRVLLAENVKGLISHDKGRTLDTIVKTLSDIGYTVDFNVLNSKYFNAAQSRERIFIVAIRNDLIDKNDWIIEGNNVVKKGKQRISKLEGVRMFNFKWPAQEKVITVLRDILEEGVPDRYYLSEERKDRISKWKANQKPLENIKNLDDVSPCLTARGAGEYHSGMILINDGKGVRVPTERESFRLQGFPDSEFDKLAATDMSSRNLYKQAGNAVTVNVISAIGKRLLPYL